MIIVYYRNRETGAIERAHAWKAVPYINLASAIEEYNQRGGLEAFAEEFPGDSLTVFLWERRNEQDKQIADAVRDAMSALEEAMDCVRYLEGLYE